MEWGGGMTLAFAVANDKIIGAHERQKNDYAQMSKDHLLHFFFVTAVSILFFLIPIFFRDQRKISLDSRNINMQRA